MMAAELLEYILATQRHDDVANAAGHEAALDHAILHDKVMLTTMWLIFGQEVKVERKPLSLPFTMTRQLPARPVAWRWR